MAEIVWGAAVLVLLVVGFLLLYKPRKTLAGEMDAPMDLERHRAQSEAEMAAPISEEDEAAAAPLVAYVEEIGTGEFPSLAFAADPLGAPIPAEHRVAEPVFFTDTAGDLVLYLFPAWPSSDSLPLSSVQVPEPDPLELESFTRGWTRQQIAELVAEAKAEASR